MPSPRRHRPTQYERKQSWELESIYKQSRSGRVKEEVPAVDYKLQLIGPEHPRFKSLKQWVNLVRLGRLFSFVPALRQSPLKGRPSNRSLWREVAYIYLELIHYGIIQKAKNNPVLPLLDDLIFRNPSQFRAGSWGRDKDIWLIFIQQMP